MYVVFEVDDCRIVGVVASGLRVSMLPVVVGAGFHAMGASLVVA